MNQRKSANGRPSGTDGSDFSYRMVIDSRYQKVAECKSRLSVLIFTQAIIQLMAAASIFLSTSKGGGTGFSCCFFFHYILHFTLSWRIRKRSRVNFLKFYAFGSSVALLISIASLTRSNYILQVIQDLSTWGTSVIDLVKSATVLLGSGVHIFAIGTTTSLIRNMAPPKRTS